MSHNGITVIEGLDTLVCLNARARTRGLLRICASAHSNIEHARQTKLRVLDLAGNKIARLTNLSHLVQLEDLWVRGRGPSGFARSADHTSFCQMNDCAVVIEEDLSELRNARKAMTRTGLHFTCSDRFALQLTTIYLERNPIQRDPRYAERIRAAVPSLKQLDALEL